jgi:hypothetical protein
MRRALRRNPLLVAFLAAATPLIVVPATSGSAERAFHDTVGDVDCCTRDLTDVTVRNDDAGKITFSIHFDGRFEGDDDDDLTVALDTDRNPATGQTGDWGIGVDYIIGAGIGPGSVEGIFLGRWTGHAFRERFDPRVHISMGATTIRISLDRHVIGDTDGFRFSAQALEVAKGYVYWDQAPDSGSWSFPLRIATRRLRPSLQVSNHPRAGKRFTAQLALHVRGTRRLLGSGRVLCRASLGGPGLRATFAGFAGRRAVCIWNVPPGARGTTIRGSVTIAITSGARISRRFAAVLG